MSTEDWLSAAVVKVSFFLVGMVVLRGMRVVITPPSVSSPSVRGVTSSSTMSPTSPASTPAWIAAPSATASSGLTLRLGSLPKISLTFSWTAGIRDIPPTIITSSIWPAERPESDSARWQGPAVFSIKPVTSCSNRPLVSDLMRCCGPLASAVMKGRLISVSTTLESSTLARSAASRRRCRAMRSAERSMPVSRRNSVISQSRMA